MFKLFKRTAPTPTVEEPVKKYAKWSVFTYGSDRPLKQVVAPDFTSDIMNVKREGDFITVSYEDGYIELPANHAIVVRRYYTNG